MSMQDSLTLAYTVFAVGILVLGLGILQYVLMQSDFLMGMQAFQNSMTALGYFDYLPVAFMVGSFISSMYLAAQVRASPIFLPISMIFLIIATFIGYVFTIIPTEMAQHTVVAEVFGTMGMTSTALSNLHIIVLVTGLAGMITLYAFQGTPRGGRRAPL